MIYYYCIIEWNMNTAFIQRKKGPVFQVLQSY